MTSEGADSALALLPLPDLLERIRACRQCEAVLPLEPRPVVSAHSSARVLIIGQAPGTRVHETGVPWNDPSGDRLRDWMGLDRATFYDPSQVAIMPMGFCYPGKGKSGDLPPRPECAPLWHDALLAHLPEITLTLLVGRYAQQYYLNGSAETLTERVKRWQSFGPGYFPLPHPSPRNTLWLRRNTWFERDVVPDLRERVRALSLENKQN